jgi:hypothetical protein
MARILSGTNKSSTTADKPARATYPVNLLESELGEEVCELLSHSSLQLSSGHQAWLLMAIMYLVERERRKVLRQSEGGPEHGADGVFALARAQGDWR